MPIAEILRDCLAANGLTKADGRPLYRYEASDEAITSLAEMLRPRLHGNVPLDRAESAGFCLVLAKRGVPTLNADALSWPTLVRAALGNLPEATMNGNAFRAYTDSGMGWWSRTPIRVATGTRWLTTLWCEGAGPLNLIQREYNAVRTFFSEVLRVHTEYPARDLDAVIEEEDHRLPSTLRNELVRDLTREVVQEATTVRDTLALHGVQHDPLQWLAANDPSWSSRWPFPISDENSGVIELLVGLIRQRPPPSPAVIQISTVLEAVQQGVYELRRILHSPARISQQQLQQLAGTGDGATTVMASQQWWKLAAGNAEYDAAKVIRPSGTNDFTVVPQSSRGIHGSDACRQINLVSRRGAQTLFTSSALPGSNALPDGLWVFSEPVHGSQWRFVGSGSHATQHPTLLFALPAEQPPDFNGEGVVESIGKVRDSEPPRTVYRLAGDIDLFFQDGGGIARLRTRAAAAQTTWLTLRGKSMTLGFGGSLVWCGLPTLCEIDDSGTLIRPIQASDLEWRPSGSLQWTTVTNPDHCLGRIQIRYAEDDTVLYRQELAVLPKAFAIHSRGTTQPRTGIVSLHGLQPAPQRITPAQVDAALQVTVESEHDAAMLTATSESGRETPPTFRCRISWTENRSAELEIATPVSDIFVCDAAGRRCQLPGPIPVQLLDGLYLRATYPTQYSPVIVDNEEQTWAALSLDAPDGTSYTLPLSCIAERARGLLAVQDWNGGVVTLRVRRFAASAVGQVSLRVARTAGQLHLECDPDGTRTIGVPEAARTQPWLRTDLRLELSRLATFDAPISDDACQQVNDHAWRIDSHKLPPEGVLATVRGLGDVCLTPVFVPPASPQIMAEQLPHAPTAFDTIVRMQGDADRFTAWRELLRTMSFDSAHPDWGNLVSLLAHATTLPETTYNVVEALATLPQAAAACVVRNQTPPLFWQFMERLSFLWSLVPLSSWIQAVHRHAIHVRGLSPTTDLWTPTMQKFVSSTLRSGPQCMRPIVDCLALLPELLPQTAYMHLEERAQPENLRFQQLPAPLRASLVEPLASRLIEEAANSRWPGGQHEWLGNEHVLHMLEAFGIQHGLLGEGMGYRRAVICAPLCAASRVVHGNALERDTVRDMIRYRAFDREWYDEMQSLAVYYLLSRRLVAETDLLATFLHVSFDEDVNEG